MFLSPELTVAIQQVLQNFEQTQVSAAAKDLSAYYRQAEFGAAPLRFLPAHYMAYAATRMPATYAVIARAIKELIRWQSDLAVESLLDIGAGPGTAAWAMTELFPINKINLFERDQGFVDLGKKLAHFSPQASLSQASWHCHDVSNPVRLPRSDVVIASYSLGEISGSRPQVVDRCIEATDKTLIIIEPGTPRGYSTVLEIRTQLIDAGMHIVAPCPHEALCPMSNTDWCHFSQRLERCDFHRLIKNVELGYEDEKYSYVIATKEPMTHYASRIVRKPIKRTGHVYLDLCTNSGIKRTVVSRRNKEEMRQAKKVQWGDVWGN